MFRTKTCYHVKVSNIVFWSRLNNVLSFVFQAAGGLSVGYSIWETAIKEASEEANVSENLAEKIIPAGCVS